MFDVNIITINMGIKKFLFNSFDENNSGLDRTKKLRIIIDLSIEDEREI